MSRRWFPTFLLAVGVLSNAAGRTQKPADTPATPEHIATALKVAVAAAAEYEIRVGTDEQEKPLELVREPKLRWSNPAVSDIQGSVFLWVRDGRPLAVASIYQWFSPRARMEHE